MTARVFSNFLLLLVNNSKKTIMDKTQNKELKEDNFSHLLLLLILLTFLP